MKKLLQFVCCFVVFNLSAQQNLTYQQPPDEIMQLADVELAPGVQIDSKGEQMVLLYRDQYKSIAELSETELRLAGLRINPVTNIGSRTIYYTNIQVKKTNDKEATQVSGLPDNARLSGFRWSPDETMIACLNTTSTGVEVWVLNIAKAKVTKITEATVNANMGSTLNWFDNNQHLLVKMLPKDRKSLINTAVAVPTGPTVSVSDGSKAQNRTYQDLLKTPNDEFNFEQLARSSIKKVSIDGKMEDFLPTAMYRGISFSPDGNYIMVTKIKRPFSYIVTYSRFPSESKVYDTSRKMIAQVNDVPLDEVRPKGFMATRMGKRSMSWRSDKAATLVWCEALDNGDPEVETEHRDVVYELNAPFNGQPNMILKTQQRFGGISWGNESTAIAYDYWWNTRNTKTYVFNPSNSNQSPKIISDRNYQDVYSDPGNFMNSKNEYGSYSLEMNGDKLYLMGAGYTKEGQFPFIDEYDLKTNKTKRLYQSEYTDKLESLNSAINMKKGKILVRIQSQTEYPNYYIRNINKKNDLTAITTFKNPFESLKNVNKRVISYKRDDGLDLEGTLYLPLDYEEGKKYPMILWAYPREYKDKSSASQSTTNPNEFVYPYWGSPIYWVTRGYVVLDDAAFPIVGEGDEEPNDSFRTQLVANGKAAIDAVDELGYIDRNKVAVGGHSYGAFMTANLLSHSDLFAAGIARSGAYNRTLTPFGFQSEERSYWDAPEIYYNMSPFMHADKMKTPLLLIHGVADNNSGTYPLQSERYFNALKGLGATVRLVMLPKESHGYRAKESIMHMLWEQDQWLDKHVKNKGKEDTDIQNEDAKIKGKK
ncbi:prolyl oligopeptidase family serine peptidase [Psychroserpens sp.]|uniref:S9 family peptidase n=1 Tax=Psychroserpens sp. TaxID=2020870 RepID=UPI001B25F9FF|nr:prolyl oligopeptidase family serine peptidase [Psychroserpens sp.]MBO6606874.1 S9 family peptidase [Psychroserpens sp.]MBO6630599.1 S9 family peptidase [Psychroserpens sp.]MBO6654020.1 S9 family peptidase [Psychroserpens sp.]MBO6682694.1 S9 family peptidase [Psychroserpens sp.]MBO6750646.1 S9 family peptidase [Psychroserpens sp.]